MDILTLFLVAGIKLFLKASLILCKRIRPGRLSLFQDRGNGSQADKPISLFKAQTTTSMVTLGDRYSRTEVRGTMSLRNRIEGFCQTDNAVLV